LMHPGCPITDVYLCFEPVDFRKSINGLSSMVEQGLQLNPFASSLYVFINRGHTKIKVLYWHRNGFCLWLKRLESDKFAWPSDLKLATPTISLQSFEWLLEGYNIWQFTPHKSQEFTSVS
ncbi:MAG: IS66 family insertion sequence element accessory protein TnpB, partial [Gallionellaceae bacterium]|nr:IS66 family insertion sequence element accessory protein TnpB [Gallionellaceae bacterium]